MLQLFIGVHGDANPCLEGSYVILLALGVAVEEDHIPGNASQANQGKLPGREYVCPHSLLGGDLQNGQIAIGLHREIFLCIGKCSMIAADVLSQPPLGGDVQWSALLRGQTAAVDILDVEVVVYRGEMIFGSKHRIP